MILKANPKPANPTAKKRLAFVGVLLVVCLAFGLGWAVSWTIGPVNHCVTVAELFRNPEVVDGTQVCVRGEMNFDNIHMTLLGCEPAYCGCNATWRESYLTNENVTWTHKTQFVLLYQLICRGNECTMVCSSFCPIEDMVYELTGDLSFRDDDLYPSFIMDRIDFHAARQLQDGEWLPVPLGSCAIEFAQEP